jgi:hypothetical protein
MLQIVVLDGERKRPKPLLPPFCPIGWQLLALLHDPFRSEGPPTSSPSVYSPPYPPSSWFAMLNLDCHGLLFWAYSHLAFFSITCSHPATNDLIRCDLLHLIACYPCFSLAHVCDPLSSCVCLPSCFPFCKPMQIPNSRACSNILPHVQINVVVRICHVQLYRASIALVLEACPSARSLESKPTPAPRSKHKPKKPKMCKLLFA